jgi:hypothetical protein
MFTYALFQCISTHLSHVVFSNRIAPLSFFHGRKCWVNAHSWDRLSYDGWWPNQAFLSYVRFYIYHHHRPFIPLSGAGITYFLLSFSSITRHLLAHSFLMSSINQSIHLFLGRPLLGCPSIFILITLFFMWLSVLLITCPYQANLLLLILSVTGATFKFP